MHFGYFKNLKILALSLVFISCSLLAMEEEEERTSHLAWVEELNGFSNNNDEQGFKSFLEYIMQKIQHESPKDKLNIFLDMLKYAGDNKSTNTLSTIQAISIQIKSLYTNHLKNSTLAALSIQRIAEVVNKKNPCTELQELAQLTNPTNTYPPAHSAPQTKMKKEKESEQSTQKNNDLEKGLEVSAHFAAEQLIEAEDHFEDFKSLFNEIMKEIQTKPLHQQSLILICMLKHALNNENLTNNNLTTKNIARILNELCLANPGEEILNEAMIRQIRNFIYGHNSVNQCEELNNLMNSSACITDVTTYHVSQRMFDRSRSIEKENEKDKGKEKVNDVASDLDQMEELLKGGSRYAFNKSFNNFIARFSEQKHQKKFFTLLSHAQESIADRPHITAQLYIYIMKFYDEFLYSKEFDPAVLSQILEYVANYNASNPNLKEQEQAYVPRYNLTTVPGVDLQAAIQEARETNRTIKRTNQNTNVDWKTPFFISDKGRITFYDIHGTFLFVGRYKEDLEEARGSISIFDLTTKESLASSYNNAPPLCIIKGNYKSPNDDLSFVSKEVPDFGAITMIFSALKSLPKWLNNELTENLICGNGKGELCVNSYSTSENTTFPAHAAKIKAFLSLNGSEFLSASKDGTMKIWNRFGPEQPSTTLCNNARIISAEKKQDVINAVTLFGGMLISLRGKQYIENWDTKTGRSTVLHVEGRPQINTITSFQEFLIAGLASGELKFWIQDAGFSSSFSIPISSNNPIKKLSNFDDKLIVHCKAPAGKTRDSLTIFTRELLLKASQNQHDSIPRSPSSDMLDFYDRP
jgi:WD40 repeat protein